MDGCILNIAMDLLKMVAMEMQFKWREQEKSDEF